MNKISIALAAVLMSSAGAMAASLQPADITVALIYGIKGDPFYVTMEKGARAKAEELGITLVADGPSQWNPQLQTPLIDAMIAKKVTGMVAVPNDPTAMVAVLERASQAGIAIATADTFIGDGDYKKGPVTFPVAGVSSDNFAGGETACKALIDGMGGKGSLYVLVSTPNVPSDTLRRDGCKAAVEATNGAVKLAGVDYTQSNATTATNLTQAALQRDKNIGAVFGGNLFSAQGAAAAVRTANLQGTVKIASFDAPEEAIASLKDGLIDIVIAQQPGQIGAVAVQSVYDSLMGKTDIAAKVAVPFVTITRDNVDSPEAQSAIYKAK
ncbi:MAG: sugar transporter substrate-binding protein [Proteobacteria bacterium]|nr:sugar transporter substrate-binding protein [Pseudomonadota bacterium]